MINTSIENRAGTLAPQSPHAPVAAIVHEEGDQADAVLADLVSTLRASGWRVRGLMQPPHGEDGEKCPYLIDIDDAQARYFIFQALGSEACACGLDPGVVAEASAVLRRALQQGADLVLANRFGTLESTGGGLAAEMLALMLESVPLLTVVNRRYLAAWREFTGGTASELEPSAESLRAWVDGLQPGRGRA